MTFNEILLSNAPESVQTREGLLINIDTLPLDRFQSLDEDEGGRGNFHIDTCGSLDPASQRVQVERGRKILF